jgi:glyoxylase-like metal-dependent hydrolase (beta-lactamase superfamily II)
MVLLATALAASAQPAAGGEDPRLSAELVKPGLYRINGGGGGTVLRVGAKGLIVVDSKPAAAYGPLRAEIRRIAKNDELPVRALILTATGPEQVGNVAQFAEAGVPVIVQQRALPRLVGDPRTGGDAAPGRLIAYNMDYLIREGDLEAEAEHVGRGRTGADSIVLFRDLRVVAVGDLFTHGTPEPDCASGGSFAGWAAAITHVLWFDFDVAVPSRGAPVGKRELAALKATLESLAARPGSSPSDCHPSR